MNPLMLGGEMPHWSDAAPAGGPLLQALAATATGHTLVIGPHTAEVIDAVPARHVTVLVRGVPDAEALTARCAPRTGLEICCGSLAKLAAVPAYDTVLALDGLDRTASTESPDLSWEAGLAALLAVLRPGGRLLLGLANPVGLDRLLAGAPNLPGTDPQALADAGWGPAPGDDPTRPTSPAALRERLSEAGLEVLRDYAAYPTAHSPAALLSDATLTDPDLRGLVSVALRRAAAGTEPTLADPRPIAVQLVNHGLAASLAPGWLVQAVRPGAASAPLPHGLLAGTDGVDRITHTSGRGWFLSTSSPESAGHFPNLPGSSPAAPSSSPAASGSPSGTPGHSPGTAGSPAGTAWPIPPSRALHDLLMSTIRRHDLPELRTLLTTWQNSDTAAVDPAEILVAADGRLHAMAAPTDRATALRSLATAALDEAHAEPETLTLLSAMSGVDLPVGRPRRPDLTAFRELAAANDRLARELSEAQAQSLWYEQRLATRDAELARAYRVITVLKATAPGRAATAVRGALRTGKRAARQAMTRFRP